MANGVDGSGDALSYLDEDFPIEDKEIICERLKGKPIPESLRMRVWQSLLDVKDDLPQWAEIFDLPEQSLIRTDCQNLVDRLGNDEEDKVSIVSDLESIVTRFCKETDFTYIPNSAWLDIMASLLALDMSNSQLYQCFQSIMSSYIPKQNVANKNPYHLLRLLLLYHDPEICSLLDTKKITADMFSTLWFQSLFSSLCDLKVIHVMWDIYFQAGNPFLIFYLALVILINAKEQLLTMKDDTKEAILDFLKSTPSALEVFDVEDFCTLAQYYEERTPQTFIKEYQKLIFEGDTENQSLSHALCLPVSVIDLLHQNKNHQTEGNVKFFVVDCRPADQYNNGHLSTAFHLDASLMLQEPSAFNTAVQALWASQKQALEAKSVAGGEHVCFVGSGREEEDQYVHMVVASFLQKHLIYVSLAQGGYAAIHSDPEADAHLTDHNLKQCLVCTEEPEGVTFLGKFASAFKQRSAEVRGKFAGYIANPPAERHVSSSDRLGRRYRAGASVFCIDDDPNGDKLSEEEVCIQTWIKKEGVIAHYKCEEVKENGNVFPSYLILTRTHLYLLREITHKKGLAHIISRRSLLSLVKITSKKKHAELITFKYGRSDTEGNFEITAVERLYIPEASQATKVIKTHLASIVDDA